MICVVPCFIFSFEFLCSLLISLFIMAPKYSSEVLSSVSKYKEAVVCLMENVRVLHMFYSGMDWSWVQSTICVCVLYIYIK